MTKNGMFKFEFNDNLVRDCAPGEFPLLCQLDGRQITNVGWFERLPDGVIRTQVAIRDDRGTIHQVWIFNSEMQPFDPNQPADTAPTQGA